MRLSEDKLLKDFVIKHQKKRTLVRFYILSIQEVFNNSFPQFWKHPEELVSCTLQDLANFCL